jgi:hypothetical protein
MRGSGGLAACLLLALAFGSPAAAETWRPGDEEIALGAHRLVVHAPHRPLLPVEGADGALRFDGSTTWAETTTPVELPLGEGLTIEAWVALASPPVEPASVIHLDGGPERALRLAVDPWLQPSSASARCAPHPSRPCHSGSGSVSPEHPCPRLSAGGARALRPRDAEPTLQELQPTYSTELQGAWVLS